MCMLHFSPDRQYRKYVLGEALPRTPNEHEQSAYWKGEIESGAYRRPAYLPSLHELSAHLAENLTEARQYFSFLSTSRKYPVCDIIEGIADIYGFEGKPDDFTRKAQSAALARAVPKPRLIWHDATGVIGWVWLHREKLPLTAADFADIFAANAELLEQVVIHNTLRGHYRQLLDYATALREQTHLKVSNERLLVQHPAEKEPLDLIKLRHLLNKGYTLTESYRLITTPAQDIPRRRWRNAWLAWRKELASLALPATEKEALERRLTAYSSPARKALEIANTLLTLLLQPGGHHLLASASPPAVEQALRFHWLPRHEASAYLEAIRKLSATLNEERLYNHRKNIPSLLAQAQDLVRRLTPAETPTSLAA